MPCLLPDKKHECSFTYQLSLQHNSNKYKITLKLLFGPLWKYSNCTLHFLLVTSLKARYILYILKLLLETPLKARYLHITIAVWEPFKSKVLTHYNCCWGLWEQGTCTLQLLLGALLKATYFTLQLLLAAYLKVRNFTL